MVWTGGDAGRRAVGAVGRRATSRLGGGGDPGSTSFDPYVFFNRLLPLVLLPVVAGFVGFALIIAGSVGEFWLFSDQPYGQPNGRDASWTLFLLGHPVLAVGTALLSAATARSRTFPSDTGMVFAILCTCGALVPFIGVFILAGPFVWLGYLLW